MVFLTDRINEAAGNAVDCPALLHVHIKGLAFELGQDEYSDNVGVDEIIKHKIYQPVAAAERNRRFASGNRKRLQSCAFAASQNHCQYSRHDLSP